MKELNSALYFGLWASLALQQGVLVYASSSLIAPQAEIDILSGDGRISVLFGWSKKLGVLWSQLRGVKHKASNHYTDVFAEMHEWERRTQTVTMIDDTNVTVTLITPTVPQETQSQAVKEEELDLFQYSHARKRVRGRPSEEEIRAIVAANTAKELSLLPKNHQQCFKELKEAIFGDSVDPEKIRLADQMVVMGDRDAMLLAFLKRKHFKVKEVLKAFEIIYAWRAKVNAEQAFDESRLAMAKVMKHRECWPTAFYPRDKEGDPILVDRFRLIDLKGLRKEPSSLDMSDMVNYYIRCMEGRRRLLFPALSRASGRLVTRYLSIIDVSSLGPQHLGRDAWSFMREMGTAFHENYSDMVKGMYIINAPWLFHKVWGLVKAMMSEETLARLQILGHDDAYDVLSKVIPEEHVKAIMEGDVGKEREVEKGLFHFLDREAELLNSSSC